MGDPYLRHLLVVGATAVIRYARRKATTVSIWADRLLARKPRILVTERSPTRWRASSGRC